MSNPLLKPGEYINYFGEALIILELCEAPNNGHQQICYMVYDEIKQESAKINPMYFVRAMASQIDPIASRRQVVKYFKEPQEIATKLKIFGLIE